MECVSKSLREAIDKAASEGFIELTAQTKDAAMAFFAACVATCRPFCVIRPKVRWAEVELSFATMPGCIGFSRGASELVEEMISSFRLRPGSTFLIGGQVTYVEVRRDQAENLARDLIAVAQEDMKFDHGDPLPEPQALRVAIWGKAILTSLGDPG